MRIVVLVLLIFMVGSGNAQALPDYPVLERNVALVENTQAQYPAVPPLRTSADGGIEPVALGGIKGRGLWLDGHSGVVYEVSPQTRDVSA